MCSLFQSEVYWPIEEETVTFIPFQLQFVTEVDHVTHIERTIKLSNAEEVRCLFQFILCFSSTYVFIHCPKYRLLDSLVVQYWLRVREVPGSFHSQGPRHTKDFRKMVPVVPLFRTEHSKGKILALSQESRQENKCNGYNLGQKVGGHWPLWRG